MNRLERLENLLIESPDDPFILYAIAKEREKNGELEIAEKNFSKLSKLHPDYVGTYYHWGGVLVKLVRIDEAISVYKAGLLTAQKLQDNHAYGELFQALQEISDEE